MRTPFAVLLLLLGSVFPIIYGCGALTVTEMYEGGVVVSVSPAASEVGRTVLADGGNAFDAAVAIGLALAVTSPQAGNIGGGGFAVMRQAETGEVTTLDFRETAPMASTEDMFLDDSGEPRDELSIVGALASGVPGSVAGLYAIWEKYGTREWADLVTHAARLADTGFAVDANLAKVMAEEAKLLGSHPETRAYFLPNGNAPKAGEVFVQADLARTLYMIAAEGPTAFYEGEIADSLIACMEKYGGIITADDLVAYQPVWREPLHFKFDTLDIYSMGLPSSGGTVLGQILGLIEPYDFSRYGPASPEYIHLFCEAARLAFADRAEHLGDPDFWSVPSGLLNPDYLSARGEQISLEHAGSSGETQAGYPGKYESDNTTHYCVYDSEGNMVSVTTTLNSYFGSGLAVGGAGFLLNNEMDDFVIKPGHPNKFGLVGAEANKIEPGKRMLSSMTPTLVLRNNQPVLILGSPGGSKIITAVAQGIINFTRFGLSARESVEQPRFHHQWLPDKIYLEQGGFDISVIQGLIQLGHQVEERTPYGALEMIAIDPSGLAVGAADPRRGGAVAGCHAPLIH